MKKTLWFIFNVTFLFCELFVACKKSDYVDIANDRPLDDCSFSVAEAQAWYETNNPGYLTLKSSNTEEHTKEVMPAWECAFKSQNEKVEIIEANILSTGGFGYATEESFYAWERSDNNNYMASLPRLVVMRDKKSGEIISFVMTIIGDKECLEKKQFKLWNENSYLKKDKEFSGLVLFHNLDGEFVNG